jgi:hypothetical protein
MKNILTAFSLLWFWTISFNINSQSITLLSNNYSSYCAGSTIEIPVNLSGAWNSNNVFRLKLNNNFSVSYRSDTTFYVQAENNQSPLRFKLPALYNNDGYYPQSQDFTIVIQSTNPMVNSNSHTITLKKLPSIKLLGAIDGTVGIQFNEYRNPDVPKMIKTFFSTGTDDNTCRFKLNDSTLVSGGIFNVSPTSNYTYSVVRIWNSCGIGRVLGNNAIIVKVNPFRIKNASVIPNEICENRKIRIKFDYEGKFNPNNQFLVDLCNRTGDTVRVLNTFTEDSTNVYADIPSNISAGTYAVRVRGTSPDMASRYYEITIQPKPILEISGYANQEPYPIDFPLSIRVKFDGGTISPIYIRLSDGSAARSWGGAAGTGYLSDITVNLKPNKFYTIDSVFTSCGVIKDYTVIGAKTFNVLEDFYIQPLPKQEYCEGEKIRFKIKSDYIFAGNNNFTLNLYSLSNLIMALPVTVVGDSLEAILPSTAQLSPYSYENFSLTLSSSSPQKTSLKTWENIILKRKPDFGFINTTSTLSTPGLDYMYGMVSGNKTFKATINDGVVDKEYVCYPEYNENHIYSSSRRSFIKVFVAKTQTFFLKSITNVCGTKTFPLPLTYTTVVSSSPSKYIKFTNLEKLQSISRDKAWVVNFDTIGTFSNNEQFIVYLKYNGLSYEVGRGQQSPVTINIPTNFPSFTYTINGTLEIKSSLQNTLSQELLTTVYNKIEINFDGVSISPGLEIPIIKTPKKTVYTLIDDEVTIYVSSNLINCDEYRMNGKWKWRSSSENNGYFLVKFKITKDTTLFLEAIRDGNNEFIARDTLNIKIKKFRISAKAMGLDLCQGDKIEVFFKVEGDKYNQPPSDFKVFIKYRNDFLGNRDTTVRELPVIQKKQGSYIVKIPDFPYTGDNYKIQIVPTDGSDNDFATYSTLPNIRISRKIKVGLTAMDGSNIAWIDGTSTGISLKAAPVGVNMLNPYWSGTIEQINGNQRIGISSSYSTQTINATPSVFKINNIQNQCGYGEGVGIVEVKRCQTNVNPYNIYYFPAEKEIYSSSYILLSAISPYIISPNERYLFSAKNFTDINSGFEMKGNNVKSFEVEVKGCIVTPR